jgi:hypothetical protein
MFYDAIKAAYPQTTVIATTTVTSRPMDVIDQPYYRSAEFFGRASAMFDSYDRNRAGGVRGPGRTLRYGRTY